MTILDSQRTRRLLFRYRFMFRFSVTAAALGAFTVLAGLVASLGSGVMSGAVPLGLTLTSLGGLLAYKVLTSTVRVLDRAST